MHSNPRSTGRQESEGAGGSGSRGARGSGKKRVGHYAKLLKAQQDLVKKHGTTFNTESDVEVEDVQTVVVDPIVIRAPCIQRE
jgi:ribosomal protein L15